LVENSSDTGEQGSLTRSAVHGVFWITATRAIKAPLNLIATAVLARLLTPSDFGIVAIAMLVTTLSDVLVDGSFGMVLIQRRTISPAVIGASLALSMTLAALFAGTVIIGAPFIEQEFGFPHLQDVLLLLAAALPITAITTITTALLQRAMRFRALTFIAFVSQLAYTITAIALAVAGAGLWSLIWAQLASFFLQAAMGFLAVRRQYQLGISQAAVREVFQSGGMFTVSKLLNWAATSADRVVIGRFLGAADLGYYSRAVSLMTTARQLTGTGPVRVLFSTFAKIQHDQERMRKGYLRALSLTLIMGTLVSGFVIVNAELIVRLLLGPQWLPTIPLIQLLFSAFLARSGYIVAEAVPLALGLGGQSALRQAAQLILVAVGAAVGAQFGVIGAVVGLCAAHWLFYLLVLLLVQRLIHPGWLELLRVHAKSVLVALPPILLALATRWALPTDNLLLKMVPAAVFAITAVAMLASAPAALVTGDVVRARSHVWARFLSRLPRLGMRR
jgi:teichuronic acid exporter